MCVISKLYDRDDHNPMLLSLIMMSKCVGHLADKRIRKDDNRLSHAAGKNTFTSLHTLETCT